MAGDAGEDIFEPGERIDMNTLAGSYETAQHCGRPSTDITSEEHPVAATHSNAADGMFGAVIVDVQATVFQVARQRLPVFECVADSAAFRALWQYLELDLQ